MDGSLNQLLRLLANRGLEWLRQKIMDLPDPCPPDHPDLAGLVLAARVAPILSGLRGRISPLEVIVLRRLTPEAIRSGLLRVLDGSRSSLDLDLVQAGGLMMQDDPLWQLAGVTLAEDDDLPLQSRLAFRKDPDLIRQAEVYLTAPPDPFMIGPDHVARFAQMLMLLYHFGARRPALSGPRAFTAIHHHLMILQRWSQASTCTASKAQVILCLRLIDPDHELGEMLSDLIQTQRPDGSFPARTGFSTQDQDFAAAVLPTALAVTALHMVAYRRWQGPAPVWLDPQPLQATLRILTARLITALPDPVPSAQALFLAATLGRATGEDWFRRLSPLKVAGPRQLARLARLCFRDPVSARQLRQWLHLDRRDLMRLPGVSGVEARWLWGKPVLIGDPPPEALLALWDKAARSGDVRSFMALAATALHHQPGPTTPAIRAMTRRLAAEALAADVSSAAGLCAHLDRMTLLVALFETVEPVAAAA